MPLSSSFEKLALSSAEINETGKRKNKIPIKKKMGRWFPKIANEGIFLTLSTETTIKPIRTGREREPIINL